jgi:ATP-dependent Clp protease ATP-binding subunit ClpC
VLEHLVEAGYQPEFGARELKRQIRQEIERKLAKEMLSDTLKSGDTADVIYDKDSGEVKFNRIASASKPAKDKGKVGNGHDAEAESEEAPPPKVSGAGKGRKKRGSAESGKDTK